MKKSLHILIAVNVLFLVGCSQTKFAHTNYTPEKWSNDLSKCQYQAEVAAPIHSNASAVAIAYSRNSITKSCLKSKGWVEE